MPVWYDVIFNSVLVTGNRCYEWNWYSRCKVPRWNCTSVPRSSWYRCSFDRFANTQLSSKHPRNCEVLVSRFRAGRVFDELLRRRKDSERLITLVNKKNHKKLKMKKKRKWKNEDIPDGMTSNITCYRKIIRVLRVYILNWWQHKLLLSIGKRTMKNV